MSKKTCAIYSSKFNFCRLVAIFHSVQDDVIGRDMARTCLAVPARSLHEETVRVGALTRRTADVLTRLLGDVTLQRHLVERPLVLPSHLLHDGGKEGLRVEQTCNHTTHKFSVCLRVLALHTSLAVSELIHYDIEQYL